MVETSERPDLSRLRQRLRLETLYDLLVALHEHRTEQELVDELLQRVCAVLDPSAAIAATRDDHGQLRALALAGWGGAEPTAPRLFGSALWKELLLDRSAQLRRAGTWLERPYEGLLAVPISYRSDLQGLLVVLDKETRGRTRSTFSEEDRRFLESVSAIAGVTLDGLRQVENLMSRSERLEAENKLLRSQMEHHVAGQQIVAEAAPMRRVLDIVDRVAPRGINVLVRGESGTGKELVAQLLHQQSERPGNLVAVNCAALPESLLESELFGIEGGVATGVQARTGRFELADGGTLFLDEIGDLQVSLQVKLLRALQEREVMRLGGTRPVPIDVRLITATHRPLEELVADGSFREDLYYRLKGVELHLPPLRERREDIPHLVHHFLERFCAHENLKVPVVTGDALQLLLSHDYSGNVRELQSVVEGAVALAEGAIDAQLVGSLLGSKTVGVSSPEALDLSTVQRRHIRRVLKLTDGNKSAAARLLGVDRRTLLRKGF